MIKSLKLCEGGRSSWAVYDSAQAGHDPVYHDEADICPVCKALDYAEELHGKIEEVEQQVEDLEAERDDMLDGWRKA